MPNNEANNSIERGASAEASGGLAATSSLSLSEAAMPQNAAARLSALSVTLRDSRFLQLTNARLISLQAYQLIVNAVLIGLVFLLTLALLNRPVKNQYFIVDEQGRVITQMALLSDPVTSSNKARTFADDCIRQLLNLDFVHYKRQLANAESCFTRRGFVQVVSLMQERGMLAELAKGYHVGSVVPKQANFLKSSSIVRGRQKWWVKGSYLWSLQQGKKTIQFPLSIEVTLVAVDINTSVHGMAIETISITRA